MEKEIKYKGKVITVLFPSGYYQVYSDKEGRFLKFDELDDAKALIDSEEGMNSGGMIGNKFKIGDSVVVNTGGKNSFGFIWDKNGKSSHGYYWESQDAYLVKFNNGTSQYIPSKYINKHSNSTEFFYDLSKIPDDIFDAIYSLNSRFGDGIVSVKKMSDDSFLIESEDKRFNIIIEKGVGDLENKVWEFFNNDTSYLYDEYKYGGGVRSSNKDSRALVQSRTPFNANNLSGEFYGDTYVVKSYGYYPVFVYKNGTWYENSNKYSKSTAKQMGQARPTSDTNLVSTEELKAMYEFEDGGSVSSELQSIENTLHNQLSSGQKVSVELVSLYVGRKPNYEENIVGYKIRKCYLQPYFKRID